MFDDLGPSFLRDLICFSVDSSFREEISYVVVDWHVVYPCSLIFVFKISVY